jgi:outer membrane protein OmpA-like peptidoglycan-associated protein
LAAECIWPVSLDFRDPHRKRIRNGDEIASAYFFKDKIAPTLIRQKSAKEQGMKIRLLLASGIALSLSALAQTATTLEPMAQTPTFRVVVTTRTTPAVNYRHHSGATKVNFAGTELMPSANGEAEVNSKRGTIEVKAEFGNLQSPKTFGNEYLTYILWAISPEGRAVNLGEVLVGDDSRSKLHVTTDLQAFALIVTAEPYYAVRQPSNVVVLENVIRKDTKGTVESVDAKYELMERGGYIPTGYKFDPVVLNAKLPLEFFEARNAVRIAKSEGAEQYAPESYQKAVQLMDNADGYATRKNVQNKPLIAVSRDAVQTAEDARAISVKKMDDQRIANNLQNSTDAQARAQAQADDATRQKERAQSDTAKAQSDMAASQAASAAAVTAAQADADQSRLAAQQSQQNAQQAEADKAAMRARLSAQLNSILQTRDSARGLIVSMSDVLFDSGQYSLKPGAREKLAKVAGILLAYPGLNIAVGGYTDNVGGDDMNQRLSENRATSVRDYLVQQGVTNNSVSARGFGNTLPVASNDSSAGRQQNRRVELVVSGDAIGNSANVTTGNLQ